MERADGPADATPGPFDAIAGHLPAAPSKLALLHHRLGPGGRLMLLAQDEPQALLAALIGAGFIHCLAEPLGRMSLYRGERPPEGARMERLRTLAASGPGPTAVLPRYLYLLVTATPNRPVWKLEPGEQVEWHAATDVNPSSGQQRLLVFSSLVKAVAFMQSAIRARTIGGANKIGKFPAAAAQDWPLRLLVNPQYAAVAAALTGPPLRVDPHSAVGGEE